jgi:WD40 repeat protein
MHPLRKSHFDEAIIYTKIINNDTLLVVDATTTINYLDMQSLEVKSRFKANVIHTRYSTKVFDFSQNTGKFATISLDSKNSRLYDTKAKKIIAKVDRHHGLVSCVGIDPKDRYMFSCGDDGLTFAVDISSGQLLFTLPAHVDFVNDIAFSDNGKFVATAGYDKNIFLFNLDMMVPSHKLKAHSAPVMKLQFLSENRLFSVDKKSSAIIWDINSTKIIAKLNGIHDDIMRVTVGNDNKFLFLGTKLGYIIVYDLNNYSLISRRYIKLNNTITSLNFNEINKQLIIGTDSGDLLFYNIFEHEGYLNELLVQKKYNEMQVYVDKNPLLEYTKASQIVVALWERTLQKAKEFFGNSDKVRAIRLFQNFKTIPAKKQIMHKLIQEYSEFDKFIMFVNQGKIALAYSLANIHPLYKESNAYKTMELKWETLFALAQKYVLDPKTSDKVSEILAPYRGISEKTLLIQDMMANAQLHRRFRASIGQKDFKLSFELLKQHPFLKEYSDYKALAKYADTLYIQSHKFLEKGDTHSAIKILRILLDFEDFKDEVKSMISEIENRQKFFHAIELNDMIIAYNLLDASDYLQKTEDGKKLQKLWESELSLADTYAANGDVAGIKAVLEKYMKISSKNIYLASTLSSCYIAQLESSIRERKDQKIVENGIKNYILYFGLTEQILIFFEMFKYDYPTTKLNIKSLTDGSINSWRPSMMVDDILK